MTLTDLPARLQAKIEPVTESGCWMWTGCITKKGYALVSIMRVTRIAHRAIYELLRGPIPVGLTLDHLCRVRCCVNPEHLEPVTNKENVLRGVGLPAINARKTHCKRGHPFDDGNTYRYHGKTGRWCHQCCLRRAREQRQRAQHV